MFTHRLRRWANISPALGQRLVFAGLQDMRTCKSAESGTFEYTRMSHNNVLYKYYINITKILIF